MSEHPYDWMTSAPCVDLILDPAGRMDLSALSTFFVGAGHLLDQDTLDMCRQCPVRMSCLEYAYTGYEGGPFTSGYFAGLSYGQRKTRTLDQARDLVRQDSPQPVQ